MLWARVAPAHRSCGVLTVETAERPMTFKRRNLPLSESSGAVRLIQPQTLSNLPNPFRPDQRQGSAPTWPSTLVLAAA